VAAVYGIGLGLTFDEFGMWLHLGGLYWQRASYDAVVTVAAVLALIAYGSTIRRWRPHHVVTALVLAVMLCVFGVALKKSLAWAQLRLGPRLYQLEMKGPT
jgi:Na+/pantothenate symporter